MNEHIGERPTEGQRNILIDKEAGDPRPLHTVRLQDFDWLYFRPWGVMAVGPGMHTIVAATILSFIEGEKNYLDLCRKRKGEHYWPGMNELSDAFFMEIPGTMMLSSVSQKVLAGKREHLNAQERQALRRAGLDIRYLEDRI